MSFLDRLLGRAPSPARPTVTPNTLRGPSPAPAVDPDAMAVERYRYLLRTAPPEELERAHEEAFARLTPEQRDIVRQDLAGAVPASEVPATTEPRALARAATRAEARSPGTLERAFGGGPGVPGMAGSFLNTFAAVFVGTTVAQALFGGFGDPFAANAAQADAGAGTEADAGDTDGGWDSGDSGGDAGGFGGDFGDFGGGFEF